MPLETVYKSQQRGSLSSFYEDNMRKNMPPPKRDFQEANPPKNQQELYSRYDPSVGAGIAIALGSLLAYLMLQVAVKWVCKNIRRRLRRTKRFGKYFPEDELPPLEVVQKLAAEQGLEIPESLLLKLTSASSSTSAGATKNHKRKTSKSAVIRTTSNATSATTLATNTPKSPPEAILFYPSDNAEQRTFNETEYYLKKTSSKSEQPKTITVNIIGATPVPDHHKIVGNSPFASALSYDPFMQIKYGRPPSSVDFVTVDNSCSSSNNNRFVTTATVENCPLIKDDLRMPPVSPCLKFEHSSASSSHNNHGAANNELLDNTNCVVDFDKRYYHPALMLNSDYSSV